MGLEITAGPTCTVVIDRQKMYWMAGKVRHLAFGPGDITDITKVEE